MGYARGSDTLLVDSEGRISACKLIKEYLRKDNPEFDNEGKEILQGYIGVLERKELPVLILVNVSIYEKLFEALSTSINLTVWQIHNIAANENELSELKKIYKLYRPFNVVNDKIRLNFYELTDVLQLTKQNRKVFVEGEETHILIWQYTYHEREFPSIHKRYSSSEGDWGG